jgi:hypothetical protein
MFAGEGIFKLIKRILANINTKLQAGRSTAGKESICKITDMNFPVKQSL